MNMETIEELDKELESLGYDIPELNASIAEFKEKLALRIALKKANDDLRMECVLVAGIITTLNNAGVRINGFEVGRHNILQGIRKLLPPEKPDTSEITSVVRQCMADTPPEHPDYEKIQAKLNS